MGLSHEVDQEKVKYALSFRAATTEDYNKWMFVLGHFGMRHDIKAQQPKLRAQLTHAFSVMTLDTSMRQGGGCDNIPEESFAEDAASLHSPSSIALSESTNCSVQTLDDDALRQLSDAL